jgi:hypothetical protein
MPLKLYAHQPYLLHATKTLPTYNVYKVPVLMFFWGLKYKYLSTVSIYKMGSLSPQITRQMTPQKRQHQMTTQMTNQMIILMTTHMTTLTGTQMTAQMTISDENTKWQPKWQPRWKPRWPLDKANDNPHNSTRWIVVIWVVIWVDVTWVVIWGCHLRWQAPFLFIYWRLHSLESTLESALPRYFW